MALSVIQPSFAAGEISPSLYARVDLEKYHVGLALARNFFIDYRGGASNRPGTEYIATLDGSSGRPRAIPFTVSTTATYMLVFGHHYIQFFSDGAYIGGADLVSPYNATDLYTLVYVQSADVMTLTHPSYPVYNLTRTTPTTFSLDLDVIGAVTPPPTSLNGNVDGAIHNNGIASYCVTAVSSDGKEESVPSNIKDILTDVTADISSTDAPQMHLTWTPPAGAVAYYNIYKSGITKARSSAPNPVNSIFGYIGQSTSANFTDTYIAPDFSKTPPQFQDPFSPGQIASVTVSGGGSGYSSGYRMDLVFSGDGGTGAAGYAILDPAADTVLSVVITNFGKNYTTAPSCTDANGSASYVVTLGQLSGTYPAVVTYFQQRRTFGGTMNFPESVVLSQPGYYNNFDTSAISSASDSITVSLASRQDNTIKSMVTMPTGLIAFTTGGAFLISGGGNNNAITPTTITALPQASSGANDLPPLVVNYDVLYCQNRGAVVRDMAFNFYVQSYTGTDRSVLASHLFLNHTLIDWTYAEEPYRQILVVRDDGVLLSFTYVPEQEVFAWTHYDTNGTYISVASVPEGQTNAVYVIVLRGSAYFLERFDPRLFTDVEDAWFLDAALKYEGAPVTVVTGLDHLNGFMVSALADGSPVLPQMVSGGSLTLPVPASTVIAGLAYTAQMQSLRLDTGDPTIQGKRKLIPAVTLRVLNSLGLKAGPDLTTLTEIKDLQVPYTPPISMFTGDTRVIVSPRWQVEGQLSFQQDYPLPATILGIIPEVVIGDTQR